jgi:hypothetical protein
MIERLLKSRLEPVARRERQVRLWRSLAVCWVAVALTGLFFLWISSRFEVSRNAGVVCLVLVFVVGLVASVIALARRRTDYRDVARKIERDHPDLHALLITAVEQKPDPKTGQFSYLQDRVMREALSEVQKRRLVLQGPATGLRLAHAAHLAALVFALLIAGKLLTLPERSSSEVAGDSTRVKVEPGDVSVEKGTPLFVLARFSGPVPGAATLVLTDGDGETRRLPLERTLGDPVFGGGIPEVSAGFKYFVEFGGERTRDFNVAVFEYPRLERADAEIVYPEYTGMAQKRVEDTRRVTAVEGSQVTVQLQLNKPVRSARLIAKDKSSTPLNIETNKAVAALSGYKMEASQSLALELIDADGRTNKVPAQFVFDVLKNKPPEIKLAAPRGDQRVSPLEEMAFAAEAADDFGLRSVGLTYSMAGKDPATIQMDGATARHEKRQFGHMVRLEELRAAPDQLLSWFVWAEDIGPDGQLRRTESDMYFAEVRPLDEIFREGSGAEGESASMGMQMGGQTLKLAELQKQIINATWKLQRQFPATATKVPPAYKKDAEVVHESQQTALEQAAALSARVDDPRFKVLWQKVEEKMQSAVERLKTAGDAPGKLPPALNAEQEAYQALLTLSAREYQVSRGQRGGGGGGGGERNQRQLDNLELKQDKDRYETQRQAGPQQKPEQREQLAVLSRLKELAQRQQDLNERLKDLQTALREAKTEEERKELERELKRLRDEERELLADVDEMQQTMEKSDNQAQMAESRKQLEETRSHVQNAAEALEKGSVSQALSAGTRAQRELQDLRDDFRKKNSNQFAEDMREMRSEARQLAQTQEEISSKIENETNQKQKTLTASDEIKELTSKFEQQKSGLTNLLQQMRDVSEQAEPSEPMLSRQLYDTVRKTSQGNMENNLSISEELLKRSFLSEAGQFSRRTQEEMNELKRGVEEAASGVLGDEAETLRFAKSELDDLVNKIEQEMNQFAGGGKRENQDGQTQARAANAQRDGQKAEGQTQQPGQGEQGNPENRAGEASAQGQRSERGNQESQQGQRGQQGQQGNGESREQGQQQGQQPGNQDGQQQGEGNQGQRGGNGQKQDGGNDRDGQNREQRGGRFDPGRWAQNQRGGGADGGNDGGPLTGGEFREWSERLGQVEEVLDQPDLRGEVARIRDRARAMRAEFKRHSKEPQWDLVRSQVFQPLTELRNRVAEELARVQSTDSLVPIDRDPVPNKFSDLVRRYYEKLGEESSPAPVPAAGSH